MPAIYYHFATKEDLYAAVLVAMGERVGRAVEATASAQGDLAARVLAIGETLGQVRPEYFRRMQLDMNERLQHAAFQQVTRIFHEHIFGPVVSLFATAAASGELRADLPPEAAAMALFNLMAGANPPGDDALPGLSTHDAVRILLHGLLA